MKHLRSNHRWQERYCWARYEKANPAPPLLFGWNERYAWSRFVHLRMQRHAAAMDLVETLAAEHQCRVNEANGDEGNTDWKALGEGTKEQQRMHIS